MRDRCENPKNRQYSDYGGRGIKVCDRWLNFQNFLDDMGERPSKELTLDRENNDGNYCPENCRWATKIQQVRNKRDNLMITHNGTTRTLIEWSELTGVMRQTISYRLKHGWSVEEALYKPGDGRNSK